MKVNLLLDDIAAIRPDYLNIDPLAPLNHDNIIRDTFKELREIDDGEADSIVALDIIDYYTPKEVMDFLTVWVKKLKHGGILTIGFTDIYALSKGIMMRYLNLEAANLQLHGPQDKAWKIRRCSMSIDFIAKSLETRGLKILNKRLGGNAKAIVKAVRP
jgi:predicted SAM-dependent methyltransferase